MATRKQIDAILLSRETPKTIDAAADAARWALRFARRERDRGFRDTMDMWLKDARVLADWVMERTTSPSMVEAMDGVNREAGRIEAKGVE